MKFHVLAMTLAATMLVGCTKCGQQAPEMAPAPAETPAAPTEPGTADASAMPTEGMTSEAMPSPDQMNEELPPEPTTDK